MSLYKNLKMTPLDNLLSKDIKALNKVINYAEKSSFKDANRMAALIYIKRKCILWGEFT